MNKMLMLTTCEDGACCCFPPRSTVAMIGVLSTVVCAIDLLTFSQPLGECCSMKQYVEGARHVLTGCFQIVNFLLIIATVTENSLLVSIYIWFALSYVLMGLLLAILELLCRIVHESEPALVFFGCEVVFYFAISRCLPVVNSYKQHLEECAYRYTCQ